MIVPFLFTYDEYAKEQPTHLWVASKFYDFCYKNSFPILLQEKYTRDPSYYENYNHGAMSEKMQKRFQYTILEHDKFEKVQKFLITSDDEQKFLLKYKNIEEAYISLLQKEDREFEEVLDEKILLIEKETKEKIEAIITWISYPSLNKVAKKHGISVINYELSTIRSSGGKYRDFLGYFHFGNKYNSLSVLKQFENFRLNHSDVLLLNRKELINLLVDDQHVNFINEIDKIPEYEVGMALGLEKDFFASAYDGNTYQEILEKVSRFVPDKKISVRSHPSMPVDEASYNYSFDHSATSGEWLMKCKNIVCQVSNIGYEAILFGKGLITTNDNMVTSFGNASSLNYYDPKHYGLLELNFLTFFYYAPYDLMFDVDYIRYRLQEKDICKIYNYHMDHIFKRYNLNLKKMKNLSVKERFVRILDTHDIDEKVKDEIIIFAFDENIEKYYQGKLKQKIRELEQSNAVLQDELKKILSSKSWRITKPLRTMNSILKTKKFDK